MTASDTFTRAVGTPTVPDETEIEARCCWCGGPFVYEDAPLVFPGGRIAWCAKTEACRERQRSCAMSREIDGVEQWLYVPTPKGTEVCEAQEKNVFLLGNRGGGKAVRLSTPVPTPHGMKTMESLRVGDLVFDENGRQCRIVWKSKPHTDDWGTYRITFDDGTEIVCGGHHEWWTFNKNERDLLRRQDPSYRERRARERKDRGPVQRLYRPRSVVPVSGGIRTTREIAETLIFRTGRYEETNHAVRVAGACEMAERELPIHPYVLGVWLGDGTTQQGEITSADTEIVYYLRAIGYTVTKHKSQYKWGVLGLRRQLKALGVFKKKHIPEPYFVSSLEQRLELLRGLLDTDGSCVRARTEFCNTNKRLAQGVYRLACGLGIKAQWREDRAQLNGKDCGPRYRVTWTDTTEVFGLSRKAENLPKKVRRTQQFRFVVSVERVADEPIQCIEVDSPSHLYLITESHIPTHNSMAIRWLCHMLALAIPGFKYAILRTSFPELQKNHLDFLDDEKDKLGGEKEGIRYNKTDHIFRYGNGSIGYFAQCATDADVKKVLGAEVYLVVFDEAPTFRWDHMRLIAASVRTPKGSGIKPMVRYLGNPMGESIDELWMYFVDKDVDIKKDPEYRPANWRLIEMNIQDNPFLNIKEYWEQFSGLADHIVKAWKEGIRVEEDALFRFLPTIDGKPYHVVQSPPMFSDGSPLFKVVNGRYVFPDWVQVFRAYDHGFYPDPAVMLWFAVYGKRILCFKERTWYRTTAEQIAEEVVRDSRGMRVTDTFCDPSIDLKDGRDVYTTKQKMEAKKLPMTCSVNNREFFADAIHSALNTEISPGLPRIQFLAPGTYGGGCPNLIKWLPRMKWDPRNPAAMAAHKHDHWIVDLAYFLMSFIPETKPGKTKVLRRWQIPTRGRGAALGRMMLRKQEREERRRRREEYEEEDE